MRKAIIYKEWIKVRLFTPLAVSVLAGFTAYALLRIGRMYAFNGAGSVWLAVLDRNAVLIDNLKYLPALLGLLLGLVQFVPEMQQNRLKLTLHLPFPQSRMLLWMLGCGLALLAVLFIAQAAAIWICLRWLLAPELVARILMTALPWYAAGVLLYLFTAWTAVEPTWRRRLFDALVAAGVMRLLFMSDYPRTYDTLLPWIALLAVCALFFPIYSADRFRRGCQD